METYGQMLRALRAARRMSLRELEADPRVHTTYSHISHIEHGRERGSRLVAEQLDTVLGADGLLLAAFDRENPVTAPPPAPSDEIAALELIRAATVSSVGDAVLDALEASFDRAATVYASTPPRELLQEVRGYAAYAAGLLGQRMTLAQHRRLLVISGWLSLMAATLHVDLAEDRAVAARLHATATLAREAGHPELIAWCRETEAWRLVTHGHYSAAADMARGAQAIAPHGSSARIQATAQEGRALARLGDTAATRAIVERVQALSAAAGTPDQPGHHFRYDPTKAIAYTATTLAWAGAPAAEAVARQVITHLGDGEDPAVWSRRTAAAHLDLALALIATDGLDEAADAATRAIGSGRVVPSNHWRAREVVEATEARGVPGAGELREAYEDLVARPDRWHGRREITPG
ncbi:hypothetical protein Afil01_30200 [Actinorhabdospora filicis]|uniref:Helix-turn-helix domain-containing protein n=1 Tax=Actinorhabdospora filicis TaxID=1785913 RepID=A0A9W6SL26_9ACTN|nr:helix-turn-helix transcriptional regulator [Actinorhabdospora filicis]GLZ78213.1 hypothetical protein Afil01_30200 [Actinorhabdospora filicis]